MKSFWEFFAKTPHFYWNTDDLFKIFKKGEKRDFRTILVHISESKIFGSQQYFVQIDTLARTLFWRSLRLIWLVDQKTPMFEKWQKMAKNGLFWGPLYSWISRIFYPKISQKTQICPKNILTKFWINISNRKFGDPKKLKKWQIYRIWNNHIH